MMQDSFITAINTQKSTMNWFEMLVHNMSNTYTPGYREIQGHFGTFLNGTNLEQLSVKQKQGKAIPGTRDSNLFIEGDGFFVTRDKTGRVLYTRYGEFKFSGSGDYETEDGGKVLGYILDESGNILNTGVGNSTNANNTTLTQGGPSTAALSEINVWIDPSNGKYLGKYDEYKIESDGIIYGKNKKGKDKVPLFKVATFNFHNPDELTQVKERYFMESEASGEPVVCQPEFQSGALEKSNSNLRDQASYLQQAKLQLDITNKIINTNKQLLEEALRLIQ